MNMTSLRFHTARSAVTYSSHASLTMRRCDRAWTRHVALCKVRQLAASIFICYLSWHIVILRESFEKQRACEHLCAARCAPHPQNRKTTTEQQTCEALAQRFRWWHQVLQLDTVSLTPCTDPRQNPNPLRKQVTSPPTGHADRV